jgi:hypothetical protein
MDAPLSNAVAGDLVEDHARRAMVSRLRADLWLGATVVSILGYGGSAVTTHDTPSADS